MMIFPFPTPLAQPLPKGNLDIIGDVHGEWEALQALLHHLGYTESGLHPQGRKLVFVGDLCDRGPDSTAVLDWVLAAIHNGHAWAILGNHELNLLMNDSKDGSGWYFNERSQDEKRYAPWRHCPQAHKTTLHTALAQWPLIAYRDDIRIIHAAWLPESFAQLAAAGNMPLIELYQHYETTFHQQFQQSAYFECYQQEQQQYQQQLQDEHHLIPLLPGTAQYDFERSRANPIRTLTCGIEAIAPQPFYASGRWRFTARSPWWQQYTDPTPVLIGHYWRLRQPQAPNPGRLPLFNEPAYAWMGPQPSVFCLDYSVGARWRDRHNNIPPNQSRFHLAAMRWPERVLMFDNGDTVPT